MSWPIVPLKKYARVVGGATPQTGNEKFWNGDIYWATPKDLSELPTKQISETSRKITEAGLRSCAAEILPPGSVLLSSRAPIGHVAINTVPMATNQGFKSVITGPKIDPNFLYWWFDAHRSQIQNLGNGATFKEISKSVVERIEIPLPALDEQKRIAAILDKADELCRLRQRAIDRLNSLGKAIFYEMFGDPDTNPKGIRKAPLGHLIKVSSGDGLTAKNMREGPFPVYGGNGINGWHDKGNVPAETVIIGRVGVYCGAVHVTNRDSWVTDNALIVKLKKDINPLYLAAALKIAKLNDYAGRSAQPLVSGSRIYPVEIFEPSVEEQNRFVTYIRKAQKQISDQESCLREINGLFASLQHRAFAGEI